MILNVLIITNKIFNENISCNNKIYIVITMQSKSSEWNLNYIIGKYTYIVLNISEKDDYLKI